MNYKSARKERANPPTLFKVHENKLRTHSPKMIIFFIYLNNWKVFFQLSVVMGKCLNACFCFFYYFALAYNNCFSGQRRGQERGEAGGENRGAGVGAPNARCLQTRQSKCSHGEHRSGDYGK